MAIKSEIIIIKDKKLIRHESDCGKIIRQVETGREYSSAVDVLPCRYTYEETDKDVIAPTRAEAYYETSDT